MINDDLINYVLSERAKGITDQDIKKALLANEWSEGDIDTALRGDALPQSPIKVEPGFTYAYFKLLYSGRIGRFYFFEGGLILGLIWSAALITLLFIGSKIFNYDFLAAFQGEFDTSSSVELPHAATILYFIAYIPLAFFSFSLLVRRLHDLNKTGWLAILSFVPFISGLFGLYLLGVKGTDGANRYGEPEPYIRTTKAAWNALWKR